jgi:Uma2 family endonuclease
VIEILSQGNSKKEMRFKYELYEEAGVREYWIIHPENCYLQQFVLNEKNVFYLQKTYIDEDVVDSAIFPDLTLDLRELF